MPKTPRPVATVSVEWILKNVISSVDGFDLFESDGWRMMMSHKASDPQFGAIVQSLIDNGFTMPIVLIPLSDRDGVAFEQSNGHHRLTAAILLGLSEIPVVFAERTWDDIAWNMSEGDDFDFDDDDDEKDFDPWNILIRSHLEV